jgi:creatinine amidohydrolase/Fe(II)-dependent formamide hydrolase-like protein
MIKVSFDLDHADWHGHPAETLWADPVPMLGPCAFRLQNSPFFKRGVAYRDVVDATPTEGEELFDFKRVIRRSGHSTMILVNEDEPFFPRYGNAPASPRLHL